MKNSDEKGRYCFTAFSLYEFSRFKKRPAVILYNNDIDIVVTFITTKLKWSEETDVLLKPCNANRLKKISLIRTNKLATLDIELVIGKLGELTENNLNELDSKLKQVLGLK